MTAPRLFVGICMWVLATYLVDPSHEFMLKVSYVALLRAALLTCIDLAAKGYKE